MAVSCLWIVRSCKAPEGPMVAGAGFSKDWDRHLVFIGPLGLCKCDKSMSNCHELSGEGLDPLSQVAVNVLQSPKGEFPLHGSVI